MTLLGFAEHIEQCITERADDVRVEKTNTRVTYTAAAGKQTFMVIVEELAKDDQIPAIT